MAKLGKIFPLTISFAAEPIPMLPMIAKALSIIGSAGAYRSSMDPMMRFAAKYGVRPQIQKFPMTQEGITEAMQTLKDGKMRYRGVVEVQK
jgi:D-arabinose 1-dehydrogenase-like Zn-dependent alcohol dehydrogenase